MRPAASSWQLRSTLADANPARPALGLTDDAQRELGATLPPMSFAERVAADYRELGLSPTAHAAELFRSGSPSGSAAHRGGGQSGAIGQGSGWQAWR